MPGTKASCPGRQKAGPGAGHDGAFHVVEFAKLIFTRDAQERHSAWKWCTGPCPAPIRNSSAAAIARVT